MDFDRNFQFFQNSQISQFALSSELMCWAENLIFAQIHQRIPVKIGVLRVLVSRFKNDQILCKKNTYSCRLQNSMRKNPLNSDLQTINPGIQFYLSKLAYEICAPNRGSDANWSSILRESSYYVKKRHTRVKSEIL